jgi:carotenoid cleavage dioxygenase-like enzyme
MSLARGGFESLTEEVCIERLSVEGAIPDWLCGALLRNGAALFEVGPDRYNHWFDGLAMLHRFGFAGGAVSYANKFLRSKGYTEARSRGRISLSEFATDPCRSIFKHWMTMFLGGSEFSNNANVNVARLADRFVAMTETPLAIEFDPETLETAGVYQYAGDVRGQITTAHPHHDWASGETINYVTSFGRACAYQIYRIGADGRTRELIASLPVADPAYMHSFAITEHYVVLVEFPLVARPLDLLLKNRTFAENLRWEPARGTTFRVVRRDTGAEAATLRAEPCFAFHHVNAFEQDGEIVLDLVAYPDAEIIDRLYLRSLRGEGAGYRTGRLTRFWLPLDGGAVRSAELAAAGCELPRINYRRSNMRDYRYVYGLGSRPERPEQHPDRLTKIDLSSGAARVWSAPGCYPGEPVFVAAPGGAAEDDGVALAVVFDGERGA